MLLILSIGAIVKSAPVATRDYSSQADFVIQAVMQAQNEIFEFGQIASRYDDRKWVANQCDYALALLSEVLRFLELPDPRFEYDDLLTLYYGRFTDATNPGDPDDAQRTAEQDPAGVCAGYCLTSWIGDGLCDSICNNIECNFDNGDCGDFMMLYDDYDNFDDVPESIAHTIYQ